MIKKERTDYVEKRISLEEERWKEKRKVER